MAVTAVTAAAMTLLFVLMQLDGPQRHMVECRCGMGRGWGRVVDGPEKARGVRPEDLGTERKVAVVWTGAALAPAGPAARSDCLG